MNDCINIAPQFKKDEREKKRRLRIETASWQWGALGLLVLSVAVNTFLFGVINQKDNKIAEKQNEIAQLEAKYNAAVSIEKDAVQAYGALIQEVEAERQARLEQARAYEEIGEYSFVGTCKITFYCACTECCGRWADGLTATGIPVEPGIVAVDPDVIPLGSTVVIDGQQYLAADTGVTGLHVDICVETHAEALEQGVRSAEVWVVEP